MANKVDPFVVQWPSKWMSDPEIAPVITYLNRFLHDLFIRTGGSTDKISDLEGAGIYPPGIMVFDPDDMDTPPHPVLTFDPDDLDTPPHPVLTFDPDDLDSPVHPVLTLPEIEVVAIAGGAAGGDTRVTAGGDTRVTAGGDTRVTAGGEAAGYITTGSQIVICTNASAITITLNTTPDDGEQVRIKRQNGSVLVSGAIDGTTSKRIKRRYDAPHLVYTVAAGEWSVV